MQYAIGVPHIGKFSGGFVDSLAGLVRPADGFNLIRIQGLPVDEARNEIVKRFLDSTGEFLLMLDSDMVFHPRSLERLARQLNGIQIFPGGCDMVAALAFTRYVPVCPTIFRGVAKIENDHEYLYIQIDETYDWIQKHRPHSMTCPTVFPAIPLDAMTPADSTGGAFVLIKREVFEGVEQPWFVRDGLKRGEDMFFFEKARHAGFKLWVDRSVIVGHEWGGLYIGSRDFVAYRNALPEEAIT